MTLHPCYESRFAYCLPQIDHTSRARRELCRQQTTRQSPPVSSPWAQIRSCPNWNPNQLSHSHTKLPPTPSSASATLPSLFSSYPHLSFLSCVSDSDIGAAVETKAPPSMHRMRCLIRTLKDTTKEAKLHEGRASSLRLSGDRLSGFHPTRPKRGGGYGCSPSDPRG